ncbi:MAG: phenylalanine--tRNA ligase subunit beta [Candidatus Roizmanbacteria bacterium]
MNIKITHNWLLEYLDTDATPDEIRAYLSLCGPSIEAVTKTNKDFVYDIEIISNRIDYASVIGIAQEAIAILPMFGKKAKLRFDALNKYKFNNYQGSLDLKVTITNPNLCSRFTAIILDNIKIKSSPDFIKERLIDAGIKSINNVVDISNYLMLTFGQPVHVFDYDQIKKHIMIMRESKKGEKIITLDEKEITLPGDDIVIEDGSGKLIDLCGIMGGLNSSVTEKTKRVILFVQTYNKEKIRKTAIATGIRTVASTYFEKGLDEERVEPTIVYGVNLLEKYAGGKTASKLYDIYPNPHKEKVINVEYEVFNKLIGVKIEREKINNILANLGFGVGNDQRVVPKNKVGHIGPTLQITVPSYRKYDISILEDLVEEVTRVYGYHNIPSVLQPPAYVEQPKDMEDLFVFQNKIKLFLKHLGLNEVINYSMISLQLIKEFGLDIKKHLRLSNSISEDIEYLRTTLRASLHKNLIDNTGKKEIMRFFEIGKVYLPQKNDLPRENYRLGIATNTDYFDLKGIVEAVYKELNINESMKEKIEEKEGLFFVEIELEKLIKNSKPVPVFKPINPYAVIKLDKTFELSPQLTYEVIRKKAFQSKLLQKLEVVSFFENKLTFRFYYSSSEKNITEEEAKEELTKVSA